jgi:hypothetical protein
MDYPSMREVVALSCDVEQLASWKANLNPPTSEEERAIWDMIVHLYASFDVQPRGRWADGP